ncbi:Outer membrane protein TolC precursor [compost metagenome]|uniref:Outer membrane protein TolC n=1 Tax=Flavobacterium endophyticum TaxID=1540163 RepID=A0A495ML08_9FLAO|nr:TolC family protein [Flavobacterium endophyticum]RKS26636.1 outer membrane protein TolC [Flavobacterium endophyticum]
MKSIYSLAKVKGLAILLIGFIFSQSALAQTKTLTLKDAIQYALENKADAKKAKLQVENSEYQIQEVRSRALPQISADGNLTHNPILQLNALPGDFFGSPGTTVLAPLGQKWSATGGVTLTQNIFDQAVFTGLKAARSTREFYQINQQLTEEQVIERVANNYYQVFVKRQKLAVVDSNYVNTSKVKDVIKGQFDNGLAKKIDLDRITVKLYNINTQRQQLINEVQLQENSLKFYMGMPIQTSIYIPQTEFAVSPQAISETPDATQRTDYLLLKKQEELLDYQKKSVIAEYYPKLSLVGSYNYIGQGPEMPLFAKSRDQVYWSDYSTIGLNLKVPIFTGFGTRAKVRQADVEIRQLKEDMIEKKLSLDLDFENSKTQINNSIITINDQKENVRLAQEVLSDTKNNYYNGLASLTDLLDAENSLVEAQNNYTSALLDYKLAEIQLIKAKGELRTLIN